MQADTAVAAAARAAYLADPQWVVFASDGHWFAFPIGRVREVLPPRPFTRLPGCGPAVCGLVEFRGRILTIFDFGAVMGLRPARERAEHRLILLDHDGRVFGVAVDAMVAVTRLASRELDLPADVLRSFDIERDEVLGVGGLNGRPFTAIDSDAVLRRLVEE